MRKFELEVRNEVGSSLPLRETHFVKNKYVLEQESYE